jgi:endonuclease/exonuclease/phosphatase family metal-dependent hydrolase
MFWGFFPRLFGGVTPARERIEAVANKILQEDPDLFVAQEVHVGPAAALYEQLKGTYAHFYTRILPSALLGFDSGLFIASKRPIEGSFRVIPLPPGEVIHRAAAVFDAGPCGLGITHLSAGTGVQAESVRAQQMATIVSAIQERAAKPFLLLGDLNIERTGDEYRRLNIARDFTNGYEPAAFEPETATCTNLFTEQHRGTLGAEKISLYQLYEWIDYALLWKRAGGIRDFVTRLIPVYPISDHNFLRTDLTISETM